ncbi:hypothetical protein B0T09DRAFT_269223 [Sordaria sp. MPI-SDFR-AT-0083]|nr:hypothetical protein B0T09DRAFT_269223 [Sordaria sp. MPI-SDFR-AT-0083]
MSDFGVYVPRQSCSGHKVLSLIAVSFLPSSAQYWFDDEDLTEEHWQRGVTDNYLLHKYSTDNIFHSPPPAISPALDGELYRSRGLDPAWGPVPEMLGSCVGDIEPIPDQNWINLNKRVRFLQDQSCAVAKILCFPNVERGRPGPVIYALCAGKAEMEFLGLGKVKEDVLRSMKDREDEDQLCERMRLLGAPEFDGYFDMEPYGAMILWRGEPHNMCNRQDYGRSGVMLFGWPKSGVGVWVLKLDWRGLDEVGGMERLRNKTNVDMETQSRMIEQLGGSFYADPAQCPELDFLRGPRFALAVVEGEDLN